MGWQAYTLIAIVLAGVSDLFRKLASSGSDTFKINLLFQVGAIIGGLSWFLLFGQKTLPEPKIALYALIGGFLIATFTLLSFKALSTGPGVSTVMPILRVGGVIIVTILGYVILNEQVELKSILGILLSSLGIYLLFS